MGEQTGISWSHATLNFWVGCTKVSNGDHGACEHCYAETWAKRWPAYRDTWGIGATRVHFKDTRAKALKLERMAAASGEPFYCFSNSLSDMMDKEVPISWLADAFDDMRAAPHVTFLVLTKRAPLIQKRVEAAGGLPPNVALGITVVTQEEADRDIPHLLAAKAALRPAFAFLSMEPLLGAVDLGDYLPGIWNLQHEGLFVDWVITGGESGAKARPTHPEWLRSIRDQCAVASVPYHHKQNGEWREAAPGDEFDTSMGNAGNPPAFIVDPDDGTVHCFLPSKPNPRYRAMLKVGKKHAGRLLDGVLHDAMPEVSG